MIKCLDKSKCINYLKVKIGNKATIGISAVVIKYIEENMIIGRNAADNIIKLENFKKL